MRNAIELYTIYTEDNRIHSAEPGMIENGQKCGIRKNG